MKNDKTIPFTDVIAVTKDFCNLVHDEEYETVYVPTIVRKNEGIKTYFSVIVCEKSAADRINKSIEDNSFFEANIISLGKDFCYITTFDSDKKHDRISFDKNDDCPIKASFSSDYLYIEYFFKKFIDFRNNLINNNEVVKSDDIFQYFYSIVGFSKKQRDVFKEEINNVYHRK